MFYAILKTAPVVFLIEVQCVYFEVGTEFLNARISCLKGLIQILSSVYFRL